jgi:hypothetical protein
MKTEEPFEATRNQFYLVPDGTNYVTRVTVRCSEYIWEFIVEWCDDHNFVIGNPNIIPDCDQLEKKIVENVLKHPGNIQKNLTVRLLLKSIYWQFPNIKMGDPQKTKENQFYLIANGSNYFTKVTSEYLAQEQEWKFYVEWCDDQGVVIDMWPKIISRCASIEEEIVEIVLLHPKNN